MFIILIKYENVINYKGLILIDKIIGIISKKGSVEVSREEID
jgi:hypothetical protein